MLALDTIMNIVADREDLVTIPATMERDMKIWVTMKRTSESMVRMLVTAVTLLTTCPHSGTTADQLPGTYTTYHHSSYTAPHCPCPGLHNSLVRFSDRGIHP